MDILIAGWILEFFLRQLSINDCLLNRFLSVLPLSNNDPRQMKTILLRRISSEISNGLISDKILESLEMIEELDHSDGILVLDSTKAAYCAVAVECAVKFLRENLDAEFFSAVQRIWRGRIGDMERWENVIGLVSDRLKDSREEIEAAVWNSSVCDKVLMRDTRKDAFVSVKVFLAEALEAMGPTFLELAAETMNEKGKEVQVSTNNLVACQAGKKRLCLFDAHKDSDVNNRDVLGDKGSGMDLDSPTQNIEGVMLRSSPVIDIDAATYEGRYCKEGETLNTLKEAELGTPHGSIFGTGASDIKYDQLPTTETKKVQEALKYLWAVAKDPLSNMAATLSYSMTREEMNHEPSGKKRDGVDMDVHHPSVDKDFEAAYATETNIGDQSAMLRHSLMSWNRTACTFEWEDDLIESPRNRAVFPLRKPEIRRFTRRRKFKKWTSLEEETLRKGVQKYGRGHWKLILDCNREIFEERTEVDLKDKWRNMARY